MIDYFERQIPTDLANAHLEHARAVHEEEIARQALINVYRDHCNLVASSPVNVGTAPFVNTASDGLLFAQQERRRTEQVVLTELLKLNPDLPESE